MPYNDVIPPRRPYVSVPAGTQRPPWLQREPVDVRVARTYVVAYGPELVRAADAEQQSSPFVEPLSAA